MGTTDSLFAIFLLSTSSVFLLGVHGQGGAPCVPTNWESHPSCSPDRIPAVQTRNAAGSSWILCCYRSATKEIEYFKSQAMMCQTSPCQSPFSSNYCAALDSKIVDNQLLRFEDTLRGSCQLDNGGSGLASYCCLPSSLETVQVSTMGAEQHEFPYMAYLQVPAAQPSGIPGENCGGTVYNKRYIITAAHCIIYGRENPDMEGQLKTVDSTYLVTLGRNQNGIGFTNDVYTIVKAIPHPGYSKWKSGREFDAKRMFNDIALLQLDRDIVFGEHVKALELAPKTFNPLDHAEHLILSGWGVTDDLQSSGNLQRLNLLLRDNDTCFGYYGKYPVLGDKAESVICAGGIIGNSYSAIAGQGDSGGPGTCRGPNGQALLCGAVSFGTGLEKECEENQEERYCPPTVLTKVGYFRDWIESVAGRQDPTKLYRPVMYGKGVPPGKYNYHVQVTSKVRSCGGTLIADNIVVTAAHCVGEPGQQTTHPDLQVIAGKNKLGDQGKAYGIKAPAILGGFERSTGKFRRSMDLNSKGHRAMKVDDHYENDVAVLLLDGRVDNVDLSSLPRLPTQGERLSGLPARELAFPRNSSSRSSGGGQLMERQFNILDHGECQARWDRLKRLNANEKVAENVMCGVETFSGGSECDRELGGGLICTGPAGEDVLCGVQVFRLCSWSIPNGFFNVGLYRETWFDKVLAMFK